MKVAHFAPFAPHRCGLYESVRDLMVAERLAGLEPALVDTGVEGKRQVGAEDRGVKALDYDDALDADLLATHTEIPASFLARTKAPVVHVIHGRPESSFRIQQRGGAPILDLYARWAKDQRWRSFVTLWTEHVPYWAPLVNGKLRATSSPPCDLGLYSREGPQHPWNPRGLVNVLVADQWRDDADPYHAVHGLLLLANFLPGLRVHLYACQTPLGPWEHLIRALRERGILGETKGVMLGFDEVLRAADCVVSPHRIGTRVIREALAVGTPVVAPGCRHTPWSGFGPHDPEGYADWTLRCLESPRETSAEDFALPRIGQELAAIYQQAIS